MITLKKCLIFCAFRSDSKSRNGMIHSDDDNDESDDDDDDDDNSPTSHQVIDLYQYNIACIDRNFLLL